VGFSFLGSFHAQADPTASNPTKTPRRAGFPQDSKERLRALVHLWRRRKPLGYEGAERDHPRCDREASSNTGVNSHCECGPGRSCSLFGWRVPRLRSTWNGRGVNPAASEGCVLFT
jgi:hypothetical protein